MTKQKLNHILLNKGPEKNKYVNPRTGRSGQIKEQDRIQHGMHLKKQLRDSIAGIESEISKNKISRDGIYLEFIGEKNYELPIKSLENRRSKTQENNIRLLNTREENDSTLATVYVPNIKKDYFLNKINAYIKENTINDLPKNRRLINNIKDIRMGIYLESFLSDYGIDFSETEPIWLEAWLSSKDEIVKNRFNKLLEEQKIKSDDSFLDFPERSIKLIYTDKKTLSKLILLSDDLAELRKAKILATFWVGKSNLVQSQWSEDLVSRTKINPDTITRVCVLDTGINCGHPLLNSVIHISDCQSVKSSWGINDHNGHGTLMAGVATYGDLISCLNGNDRISIHHKLESVKILPQKKDDKNNPELWGSITSQAVNLAEIKNPGARRIYCMAVTAEGTRDMGRPTSWSGAIDQITSGSNEEDKPKRLIIISNGNVGDFSNKILNYPDYQKSESVHDPAQSWNCVSVGAFTDLTRITDPSYNGYQSLAPKGGLSPFSTTSAFWSDDWPVKPEVLFEGGNIGYEDIKSKFPPEVHCPDLSVLSTNHNLTESLFRDFNMTSSATAEAAWFAAQIQAKYPNFWPETIRGLLVHSAEWTSTLKNQFLLDTSKNSKKEMLRICGYGIPDLDSALYSASNNLTLISQNIIQPYDKTGSRITTNEMHLYELPWPKNVLLNLPINIEIKMRVTLSYFIEPSPGKVGWNNHYRYPSHTLRFFLNSPSERKDVFVTRINKKSREENSEYSRSQSPSDHWFFGPNIRNKGSIHSDIWEGTPQDLATSNMIAIVPGNGWWKDRGYLGKWDQKSRYSLIVSITSPEQSIDIYTPIANQLKIPVVISTS